MEPPSSPLPEMKKVQSSDTPLRILTVLQSVRYPRVIPEKVTVSPPFV